MARLVDYQPSGGTALRARLVAAPESAQSGPRRWPEEAAVLLDGPLEPDPARPWAPYRVRGGPGTGKTSLLVDIAVARLTDPTVDSESVLVLTASRRAATALREQITRRVLSAGGSLGGALREPLVRTVHSYAFAVLRLQAGLHGNPPPRLITGSEQDVVLRELLAGDVADGAVDWPASLRPALLTEGFAQTLRDLLMRSAERGLGPEDLIALGRRHKRPEWVAAGRAFAQYEQTMLLRGAVGLDAPQASSPAVDAAELVGSALSAFATDPELLAAQRGQIRHLLVDDAQHLDPQAAQLVRLIGTGTAATVIAADTDQSIFGFRGASPQFADELTEPGSDRDIELLVDHRSAPGINRVGRILAGRLPGARPQSYPEPSHPEPATDAESGPPDAAVRVFTSAAKEATAVADLLRRAHLVDGVPWSQMAVVVRSVARMLPTLRRAFRTAGVPLATPTSDLPLHRQRAVAALLLVLRLTGPRPAAAEFGTDDVITLLSGPIGSADPGALRRLRRGIRRFEEKEAADGPPPNSLQALRDALLEPEVAERYLAALSDTEAAPLRRTLAVVEAARRVETAGQSVEEVLWAAWQTSGLERRWASSSLRGGPAGEQADRDLDAVLALFEAAATFTDTLPAAGVAGFVDYVSALQIPRESRVPTAAAEAVTVLSPHAATGREWQIVAVAGVLDGLWPSLRSRGSILAADRLIDLLDGIDPEALDTVTRTSAALADERRLLLVACTRARRRLLITAVDDGGGEAAPSRFIPEIAAAIGGYGAEADVEAQGDEIPADPGVNRVLSLPSLVATLRSTAVSADPATDPRARAAVELLAELADADIPGAHPRDWYGLAGPSTAEPLWTPEDGPRNLSPSTIDALSRCSLRWLLERHGGQDGDAAPALTGTLVHTLVQAVAGNLDPAEVTAALRDIWDRVDSAAQWYSVRELERAEGMLTNFREWLRRSRDELTVIGVEVDVDAVIEPAADDDPAVRLRGRIDRLEADGQGRPVVVDVKTGKTVITRADAEAHPQLAAYQLALLLGGVPGVPAGEVGGGRLVYVGSAHQKTGAAQREQAALTPELVDEWLDVVRNAAKASVGPRFPATINSGCATCLLVAACPAQLRGKAVTDD